MGIVAADNNFPNPRGDSNELLQTSMLTFKLVPLGGWCRPFLGGRSLDIEAKPFSGLFFFAVAIAVEVKISATFVYSSATIVHNLRQGSLAIGPLLVFKLLQFFLLLTKELKDVALVLLPKFQKGFERIGKLPQSFLLLFSRGK